MNGLKFFSGRQGLLLFLVYSALLIFLGRQWGVGLSNFDDAYYAQKAKELLETGHFWIVTYNGQPDFANPPLPFWLSALAFKLFGVSGYAAVFFSALFGTATVVLTYRFALYLFQEEWTAFFAAFVLLFPGMFVDAARRDMLDVTLAFFVTAAMFAFVKGWEDRRYYLVFGLMTACAILTKSVLGLFPLVIAFAYVVFHRRWGQLVQPHLVAGAALGLGLGFSWHGVNWWIFGEPFLDTHFGALIFHRGFEQPTDPLYFLGYVKDFVKNYWPWLPFAVIGLLQCGRRAFLQQDRIARVLFLWVVVVLGIMSLSTNQTLRYLFMIFPALALIIAQGVTHWTSERTREKLVPWMAGIVMATVLFINITPFQVKASLLPHSKEVRHLAAIVRLNTPPHQALGSYRISWYNPKNALLFYSDRAYAPPVKEPEELLRRVEKNPRSTWLTSIGEYRKLEKNYPGRFYLILANSKYAYFTSRENRENIRYDFSGMNLPLVR